MERVDVKPLVCGNCGAPVPVGADDADTATCRACKTVCPVPPPVAKLRAAARTEAASREKARVLADELSAPPGFFMRLWITASALTWIGVGLTMLVWIIVGLIICIGLIWKAGLDAVIVGFFVGLSLSIPLVYNEILHDLANTLGVDLADTLGGAGSYALLGFAFFFFLAMPLILGAYAEGFESVRATLRKVLSAKPPRTEGGPAECRVCGAALEVSAGTLHARCIYCSADNLIDVPKELVKEASEDAKTKHEHVETAHEEAAKARVDGRRSALARTGKAFGILVAVFVLLGRIVAAVNSDGHTFWRSANPQATEMLPLTSGNPVLVLGQATPFEARQSFDRCDDRECKAYYFVALDKGQHLDVKTTGPMTFGHLDARDIGKWYNPAYDWAPLEGAAPYRGWYRVVLSKTKNAKGTPTVSWTRK